MKPSCALALCCLLILPLPARAQSAPPEAELPGAERRPGIILLVEGVGGFGLMRVAGELGFGWAGLPHEIRRFHWSNGPGRFLRDLQDVRRVHAKAEELAAEILALREGDPALRVFLVAHSGGTGIAVGAAELLPPDCLERVVLLSAALSPDYDLCAALRASKGGIVSYHSALDFLILGLGTWHFGTIDRTYGASAGHGGFREPPHLDESDRMLYSRLVQVPWSPRMIRYGNWGTHNGTVFPAFLAGEVARWLR